MLIIRQAAAMILYIRSLLFAKQDGVFFPKN